MMRYIKQNSNSNYDEVINNIIIENKDKILSFFECSDLDLSFDIYIYNTIEDLVNGLEERGFAREPDYMCACQKDEDNSLNFFEPKNNPREGEWNKEEYKKVIFHELVHGIQFLIFGITPEWLNEGIAKYLDGTYSRGMEYLLRNYINKSLIPKQEEIENEFGEHDYDSYDYAYIMVSYIIDVYGKDRLLCLLKDKKELDRFKVDLLNIAIIYYNNKYNLSNDYSIINM